MDENYRELFEPPRTNRVIPPRPGPHLFSRSGLRPAAGGPPTMGPGRHPEASYLLDAGLGFAFAHVGRLDLLATHYGEQLSYTLAVYNEWDSRAHREFRPGRPGETGPERTDREVHNRVRAAGLVLVKSVRDVLGEPVELDFTEAEHIQRLQDELGELTGSPQSHHAQHAGECESIRYGQMLRADGREVVVLCANDLGAQQLARQHQIARRNMYEVLGEMAEEGLITADKVLDLYFKMADVSQMPSGQRPAL